MFAALLTTLLFSVSAMCGHRTATRLGGVEANFWRIVGAFVFLAIWANLFGTRHRRRGVLDFRLERPVRHRPR